MESKRDLKIKIESFKYGEAEEMARSIVEDSGQTAERLRGLLDKSIEQYTHDSNANIFVYGGKALLPIVSPAISSTIPSVDWDLYTEVDPSVLKSFDDMEIETGKSAQKLVASLIEQIQELGLNLKNSKFTILQTTGIQGGLMAQIVFSYERAGKLRHLHLADITCCEEGKFNKIVIDGTPYMNPFYTLNRLGITVSVATEIDDGKLAKRLKRLDVVGKAIQTDQINPALIEYYKSSENRTIELFDHINAAAETAINSLAEKLNINIVDKKQEYHEETSSYFSDSDSSESYPAEPEYEGLRSYLKDFDEQTDTIYLKEHYGNASFSDFLKERFNIDWRNLNLKNLPFDPENYNDARLWIKYLQEDLDRNFQASDEVKKEEERVTELAHEDEDGSEKKSTLIRDSVTFLVLPGVSSSNIEKNPPKDDNTQQTEPIKRR